MTPLLTKGINPSPGWTRNDLLLVAGLMLIGLVLRIPGIDQGLWYDEIQTLIVYVRMPVGNIVSEFNDLNNHVLYTLSAHYSFALFGESAWSLRLPAVLFGVAAIPAVYYLGLQLASRQEAFLATVFLVASYWHVWFSQNARGYTGLVLGAVLTSIIFIRLIASSKPRLRLIIGYAVVAALAAWIHLTASMVVIAHGFIWLTLAVAPVREGRFSAVAGTGAALLLAGLFTLMLYAPIFQQVSSHVLAGVDSTSPGDEETLSTLNTLNTLNTWSTADWVLGEFVRGARQSMPGGWPVIAVMIAAFLAGCVSYARRGFAVVAIVLLPVLVTAVVVYYFGYFFFPRFLFGALAFILLISVSGGFTLAAFFFPFLSRRQVLIIGLLVALAGASMVPMAWKPKQDFEAAAEFISRNRVSDDVVVCLSLTYLPLAKYMGMNCEEVTSSSDLDRLEKTHDRVWLLYTLPIQVSMNFPDVWEKIQKDYRQINEFDGTVGGGNIIVMLKQQDSQGSSD